MRFPLAVRSLRTVRHHCTPPWLRAPLPRCRPQASRCGSLVAMLLAQRGSKQHASCNHAACCSVLRHLCCLTCFEVACPCQLQPAPSLQASSILLFSNQAWDGLMNDLFQQYRSKLQRLQAAEPAAQPRSSGGGEGDDAAGTGRHGSGGGGGTRDEGRPYSTGRPPPDLMLLTCSRLQVSARYEAALMGCLPIAAAKGMDTILHVTYIFPLFPTGPGGAVRRQCRGAGGSHRTDCCGGPALGGRADVQGGRWAGARACYPRSSDPHMPLPHCPCPSMRASGCSDLCCHRCLQAAEAVCRTPA